MATAASSSCFMGRVADRWSMAGTRVPGRTEVIDAVGRPTFVHDLRRGTVASHVWLAGRSRGNQRGIISLEVGMPRVLYAKRHSEVSPHHQLRWWGDMQAFRVRLFLLRECGQLYPRAGRQVDNAGREDRPRGEKTERRQVGLEGNFRIAIRGEVRRQDGRERCVCCHAAPWQSAEAYTMRRAAIPLLSLYVEYVAARHREHSMCSMHGSFKKRVERSFSWELTAIID